MKDANRRSFLTVGVACVAVLTASCGALQEGLAGLRAMDETRAVGAIGAERRPDSGQLRVHVISCDVEVDRLLVETPGPPGQAKSGEVKKQTIVMPRVQSGYFTVDVPGPGSASFGSGDAENSVVNAIFVDSKREFSVSPLRRAGNGDDMRFVQGLSQITLDFLDSYARGTVLMHGNFDGNHDSTAYTPVPPGRVKDDISSVWPGACIS